MIDTTYRGAAFEQAYRDLEDRIKFNHHNAAMHARSGDLEGQLESARSMARAEAYELALWNLKRIAKEHGFG
jgi:hypothetical protein